MGSGRPGKEKVLGVGSSGFTSLLMLSLEELVRRCAEMLSQHWEYR